MLRMLILTPLILTSTLSADDEAAKKPQEIKAARGTLVLHVPGEWPRQQASRIIEHEFSVPAAEGDAAAGRLTMTSASGSVKANIDRWKSQFTNTKNSKVSETSVDGMRVHQVDLHGTYADRRGPFAPSVSRPDYRMLGVIVETKEAGLYFLKFYGPRKTIDAHAKAFQTMVEDIKSQS